MSDNAKSLLLTALFPFFHAKAQDLFAIPHAKTQDLFAIPHAKAQRRKGRKVVVRKHSVLLPREGWGEEGKGLLFDRFLLNKMNLESITIIPRTSTPFLPFAFFAPSRPLREKLRVMALPLLITHY